MRQTLKQFGTGYGWVAKKRDRHHGLGTHGHAGFNDPSLWVFGSREECESYIEECDLSRSHHAVGCEWHDTPQPQEGTE